MWLFTISSVSVLGYYQITYLFQTRNLAKYLLSDRFFQLWTLWEAAIKTAGQRRDSDTEPLFAELVKLTTPGQPATVHLDDWSVQSWRRMDKFWITVIARLDRTPQTALYELKSSQLSDGRPDIHRLDDLGEFGGSFANMAGARALR